MVGYFRAGKKKVKQQPATVLDIARGQIGKQEVPKGSNWGPSVKKYLKSVGIAFAAFWCMAFVYWCISQYCQQQGIKNPLYKTGSVREQWQHCKFMRVNLQTDSPHPGDIFIIMRKDGSNHCGFVEYVKEDRIYTIEGNSNEDGSNDGYEVCRKPGGRLISTITGFIRPIFKE